MYYHSDLHNIVHAHHADVEKSRNGYISRYRYLVVVVVIV